MDGIIYLITNTANGKKYVGSTTKTIDERLKGHWSSRKTPKNQHHPLYQDFNTYGLQSFKIEPLLVMKYFIKKELLMVEDAYIALHDTTNNGYNKQYNTFHIDRREITDYETGYRDKYYSHKESCDSYGFEIPKRCDDDYFCFSFYRLRRLLNITD